MCALVSMDSTMRSNLGVGPPVETLIYKTDSMILETPQRFETDSDFLRDLNRTWDRKLKEAFRQMPPIAWAANWDKLGRGRNGVS